MPVIQANRVKHAFERLRKGGLITAFEPFAGAQLVLVAHIDVVQRLPMILPYRLRCGDLPAPQELRGFQDLQAAAVAFGFLRADPLRVQVARLHFLGDGRAGAFSDDGAGVAQVLHIQRRVLAGELAHGQRHAAQILKRIVAAQHAIGVGRTRQQGGVDLRQVAGIGFGEGFLLPGVIQACAIGMAHAVQVELCHLGVAAVFARGFPGVGGLGRFAQAGAVTALLVGKHPCRGPLAGLHGSRSRRHKVIGQLLRVTRHPVVGLVDLRDLPHGFVDPAHHRGELVAVGAGDADQHIQARALEFAGRHHVQAGHAAGIVPARLDAHCVQGLGFHHALMAHGFAGP